MNATEKIRVNLEEKSHDIIIGRSILNELPVHLGNISDRFYIITDAGYPSHYADAIRNAILEYGMHAETLVIPEGEQSKTFETAGQLFEDISQSEFEKYGYFRSTNPGIIAVGGGVVGDVAGFTACTYEIFGSPLVQVPTTLLAAIDSSIGGKNGLNSPKRKNVFGTVYQPKLVFIDVDTLSTLPEGTIKSQASEAVKYGVICDAELFGYFENHLDELLRLDNEATMKVIVRSAEIKAGVISRDELSLNERVMLNYGHTFGQTFEALSNYEIPHGDAIRMGMHYATGLGVMLGITDKETQERQDALLSMLGPVEAPLNLLEPEALVQSLYGDKKVEKRGTLVFVFPTQIGSMTTENGKYRIIVPEKAVREFLKTVS